MKPIHPVLFLLTALIAPLQADPLANEIRQQLQGEAGLVVTVGVHDPALASNLAAGGRVLVQSLVADRAVRDSMRGAIRAAGQYGAASVELASTPTALPHADNMVNVLVLDPATPAAMSLSEAEALRVVAPGGTVFIRRAGVWESLAKPADPAFGVWTQPHGDASNNGVSNDQVIAPISTMRFIDDIARGGQTFGGGGGIPVIGGGMMVCSTTRGFKSGTGGKEYEGLNRLIGRDAHSGLNKWMFPVGATRAFLAIDGNFLVSAYPEPGKVGNVFIHDLHTGALLRTIHIGGTVSADMIDGVVKNGAAWLVIGSQLLACDLATGNILWRRDAVGFGSFFSPSLTPDGQRLVVVESGDRRTGYKERWPWTKIHAITALDPATGAKLWSDESQRGEYTLRVPLTNQHAFVAAPWGIGSHYEKIPRDQRDQLPRSYAMLDVTTGAVVWKKDARTADGGAGDIWGQVTFFHGDEVFLCQADHFLAWKAATGELKRNIKPMVFNQRCVRTRATGKYLLGGFGTFLDLETGLQTDQNIARSACAVGSTPAYGSIYNGPNGCGCFAQVRGFGAFTPGKPVVVLPDSGRIEALDLPAQPGGPVVPPQPVQRFAVNDAGTRSVIIVRAVVSTVSPVRDSWSNHEYAPFPETEPVTAGDLELVAVVSEHRLEARRGGQVVWSLTADARISAPPVVQGDRVFLASHDGYVYACELATGKQLWRALVAPNHREMIAYGQIESNWPVRSLAIYKGAVCAAAGRHPELDGGIHAAGLDPATGAARWRKVVATDSTKFFDPKVKTSNRHINWITNGRLEVKDDLLQLQGFDWVHGGGNNNPNIPRLPLEIRSVAGSGPGSPPVVNAGPDQSIVLPASASLVGSTIDDGQPGPLTSAWSTLSGPGAVTFSDASAPATTATFSQPGAYVLRLSASDGESSTTDDLAITVAPSGTGGGEFSGHWKFDATGGTTAADSSGNGNPATLNNGPAWMPTGGKIAGALSFDGTSHYAEAANSATLSLTKDFTIAAWIRPNAVNRIQGIVTKLTDANDKQYALGLSADGKLAFDYEKSGNDYALAGGSLQANKWQHVAVTVSAARLVTLYIDGVSVASGAAPAEVSAQTSPLSFGRWGGSFNNSYFGGLMDDVRIHPRTLDAGEIAALPAVVTVNDNFAAWSVRNNVVTDDDDHDGATALEEYSRGTHPRVADSNAGPWMATRDGYLELSYRRSLSASDLSYAVKVSGKLADWQPDTVAVGPPVDNEDGSETVTVRDTVPMADAESRFIRLEITGP